MVKIAQTLMLFRLQQLAAKSNKMLTTSRFHGFLVLFRNKSHEPNADYLTLIDASGHCHQIKNEQVIVRQLKLESRLKLVVNIDDFVVVKLEIKDFSRIDGLNNGFGCLAYGVVDNPNRN